MWLRRTENREYRTVRLKDRRLATLTESKYYHHKPLGLGTCHEVLSDSATKTSAPRLVGQRSPPSDPLPIYRLPEKKKNIK